MENHKKLHVLYVLTKLELGGAQKVCLTLLKEIPEQNISSSILSGSEGVLVPQAKEHNSVFLLKSFKREIGLFSLFSELKAFFQIIMRMKKLKKEHPNLVVHTHSTKAGLIGRWAAFFSGIKTRIHTVHGFGFHDYQSRITWTIHFCLEYITNFITTHYICVSKSDQTIGIHRLPNFAKKSSIIRAAVDWKTFYQPAQKERVSNNTNKYFIFGTVSCLKPQKNILDLLKAFKLMHDHLQKEDQDRVILQIIGDGEQREIIEQWLATNNIFFKVDLLGWQKDVAKWMRSWNAFIMSSLWEGLPCAIIEARLSKLPVISYNIAGIPEVIQNNLNGFLVQPGDWKTLATHMEQLVKDKTLHSNLSMHQDDLFAFSNKSMVEQHKQLYQKLI